MQDIDLRSVVSSSEIPVDEEEDDLPRDWDAIINLDLVLPVGCRPCLALLQIRVLPKWQCYILTNNPLPTPNLL